MIVGDVKFADVISALSIVQEYLRREINPNVYAMAEFRAKIVAGDSFLRRVLADKKIFLIGNENDPRQFAAHRKAQASRRG